MKAGKGKRVAESLHLLQSKKEVNAAACPGETSGSFLDVHAPDNGCNGPQGFKAAVGLHTAYPGIAQGTFAVSELASNKHIDLVTLSIGGNDLLLLEYYCATSTMGFDACVNTYLPGTLTTYGDNLAKILTAIRANYQGTLILMKSYAPSADPLFVQAIAALNQVMVNVGAQFGVKFADGFAAFRAASAPFGFDPCQAGLLIRLTSFPNPLTCDVHPSPIGRESRWAAPSAVRRRPSASPSS